MLLPNRHGNSDKYRYGFNGKELDNEIKGEGNSYDFGARMYDNRIGRWFAPDPLESQYLNISTYTYVDNNPVFYIDADGRLIDISDFYKRKENETDEQFSKRKEIIKNTMADLSEFTGINIYEKKIGDTYYMWYDKSEVADSNSSEKLRKDITKAIDDKDISVIVVEGNDTSGADGRINLNKDQLDTLIDNAENIDSQTIGYGFSFYHELLHTDLSSIPKVGGLRGNEDEVVKQVNEVRYELNQKGYEFGQRVQYSIESPDGSKVIPFNYEALDETIETNDVPKGSNTSFTTDKVNENSSKSTKTKND